MTKLLAIAAALAAGTQLARADEIDVFEGRTETLKATSAAPRGVAEDYIVLPRGGELTGQMRFIMSEPSLGDAPLRFSDLALFGISGRYALLSKLELSADVELLPKQPSFTSEKPWQSVAVGLRSPLGKRVAASLSGAGGHLLGHQGLWTRESLAVEWRKRITEILTYDVSGGLDAVALSAPNASSALITEINASTSALFRDPDGYVGAWVGLSYALPVAARGSDPTTGLAVAPQPRLDFRIGAVLALVHEWDLFAEFAVIDRGDMSDPATRLPILDGGFDQRQILFGVTRHIGGKRHHRSDDDADDIVGSR